MELKSRMRSVVGALRRTEGHAEALPDEKLNAIARFEAIVRPTSVSTVVLLPEPEHQQVMEFGTASQVRDARERFLSILDEKDPGDKLIIKKMANLQLKTALEYCEYVARDGNASGNDRDQARWRLLDALDAMGEPDSLRREVALLRLPEEAQRMIIKVTYS